MIAGIVSILNSCAPKFNPAITVDDLKNQLEFLAGDSLKGRYPGSPEDSILLHHIASEFKNDGLKLYNGNGIQEFDFIASVSSGSNNSLSISNINFDQGIDFTPMSFSSSDTLDAPVTFAGYGFDIASEKLNRSDYKSINVTDKWVLILRGNPENKNKPSGFATFESDFNKALLAKDKGAAGVILVSGSAFDPMDNFTDMKDLKPDIGILCIQVKRNVADLMLKSLKLTTETAEKNLSEPGKIISSDLNIQVNSVTDIVRKRTKSGNVVAILKGFNPELSGEFIVIGAHHDHLGLGGQGSSSRQPDNIAIHYGADDNASGVAAVLELAQKFTKLKPERSIVFTTFGAEEKGILGSRYFTEHSPVPFKKIMLMINLDMIGRMKPDSSLQIGGVGTSTSSAEILKKLNGKFHFKLQLNNSGYGPSDHASFYAKDKPVLFFTTGIHMEYHTPGDNVASLNINALSTITSFIEDVTLYMADLDTALVFKEAGPKEVESRAYRGKISLGIMPDVAAEGKNGLAVLGVTEGKPAANGGIKRGDIIIAIDGKPVEDIYEYMYRLEILKLGDIVVVTVKRGEEKIDLLIQL
jgi:aminopeptidase YwaD